MITKNVKYNNVDGILCEEKLYFNFTMSEAMDMEFANGHDNLLSDKLKHLGEANTEEMFKILEFIILRAYGERSADGKRLVKNDEIRDNFRQSLVYDALLKELSSNPDEATKFFEVLMNTNSAGSAASAPVSSVALAPKQ